MNESTRQKKVSRMLQREIGEILQRDRKGILNRSMVTVTDVTVTPDLAIAHIFLSMSLVADPGALIENINARKSEIKKMLSSRIGKNVRIIPELIFEIDDLEEKASDLDRLIDGLNIPPATEGEKESGVN